MNGSADDSTFRALHRLVEHYTPDGALGRTLLGGTALLFTPYLFFGGMLMLSDATSLVAFVAGLLAFAVSTPVLLVGLFTLWPVYLSLIGNVESAAAYPEGASQSAERRESPEAVLKRRYAAGELTREEFERRLDDVLGAPSTDGRRSRNDSPSRDDEEKRRRERAPGR